MTKYILNSGGIRDQPTLKKQFHREMVKELSGTPLILFCGFAQLREDWSERFRQCQELVIEDMPSSIKPRFEMALPAIFPLQCRKADVIYMYGGDDYLIQYWMKQFNLPKIFAGKVVTGNSASSSMLARSSWSCDWRTCLDGLGILPIKFIPHYLSQYGGDGPDGPINWQRAYDELVGYGDRSLPIHALEEGNFVIIEQA